MGPIALPSDAPETAPLLNSADASDHVEKQASYPGEDTSATSKRELNGW